MKSFYLNGEERTDLQATTIEQLVFELKLPPTAILIEHNGVALHRKEWTTTLLQPGNCVELLRIVAGG